jgi:hypothetical protein
MEGQESTSPRWTGHIVVFIVSSVLITVALSLLGFVGAHETIEKIATHAKDALTKLTPWDLARSYIEHFEAAAQVKHGDWIEFVFSLPGFTITALVDLLTERFSKSITGGIVDAIQIVIGMIAAAAILEDPKCVNNGPIVTFILFVVFSLVATTILSLPILAVVWLASVTLGDLVPASPVGVYGGSIATFVAAVTSRSAEGGLHHGLSALIGRMFGERTS